MDSELIDGPDCTIHLVRKEICPLSDRVEDILTAIGLRCHVSFQESMSTDHHWTALPVPTLFTVEGDVEELIWNRLSGTLDEDRLIAALYGRSSSFRLLLSNLDEVGTGLPGTVWIANAATPQIKPRVFHTIFRTSALEDGVCVTIYESPTVLYESPCLAATIPALNQFVVQNRGPLIDYWFCQIGTLACLNKLKKVIGVYK